MLSWNDQIQLRTASALGSFSSNDYLPIRYGRTSGRCVRINARGTRYLWADHAVEVITEVRLDGSKITGWVWANEIDATGRAIAVVTLTEAADGEVFAVGRGKAATNPADIACDALDLDPFAMQEFRATCDVRDYVAGGSIIEPVSRQSVARAIASSFGAYFTPGKLIFFPGASSVAADIGPIQTEGKPYGAVTAAFDLADGSPQQTVTLRAADGETEQVTLEWVQSQRVAISVAKTLAMRSSGQLWVCQWLRKGSRVSAGDNITVNVAPFSAVAMVTQSAYDLTTSSGAAQFREGSATTATLEHQSARFANDAASAATVTRVGDEVEIIVVDQENGLPLPNAKCTLDGWMIRYTDAGGVVRFPASAVDDGRDHRVFVESNGRPDFEITL